MQLKEKIERLIKSEGISQSRMAEILEIQPAGVSHLLAGRNKPGFDLLQKILQRFPRINPDWLLLDSDRMYRDDAAASVPETSAPFFDKPGSASERPLPDFGNLFASPSPSAPAGESFAERKPAAEPAAAQVADNRKSAGVVRVVIFYDDHSFESFTPQK